MRTREEILEDVTEIFDHCPAVESCWDCPLKELCDEWNDVNMKEYEKGD